MTRGLVPLAKKEQFHRDSQRINTEELRKEGEETERQNYSGYPPRRTPAL